MKVEPYLFFDGRCEEAIAFYREAVGAEVTMLLRFKDNPDPPEASEPPPSSGSSEGCMAPPDSDEKVMHANVRIGETMVMMSDGRCQGRPSFQGFSLTLEVADAAEARRLFGALGEGGQVQMPLGETFFSPCFGMVADRFGVSWMILAAAG